MTAGQMLKQLSRIKAGDGITYGEMRDIEVWEQMACRDGANYDTTLLSEKTEERIRAIHGRLFVADGA